VKSYRIGNTQIGKFATARAAAIFHFGTEAVIPFGIGQWMCVPTGELVRIEEV
jgi:hypothetical protein